MTKYIEEVQKFFAVIKQRLVQDLNAPNHSGAARTRIRRAQETITKMEDAIVRAPTGIIWYDIHMNSKVLFQNEHQVQINLLKYFIWAYRKSPVAHTRDIKSIDFFTKIGIAFLFPQLDPNTLTPVQPTQIPPQTIKVEMPVKQVQQSVLHVGTDIQR